MQLQKLPHQDRRALKLDKLLCLAKKAETYKYWNKKIKSGEKEPAKSSICLDWTEFPK